MYVLSVTIGLSVTNSLTGKRTELGATSAADFKRLVVDELTSLAIKRQLEATSQRQPDAYFVEQQSGQGFWEGEIEPNARVTIVSEFLITGADDVLQRIATLAREAYQQEAIAVTRGESDLYFG